MRFLIYGARSIALGAASAMKALYPQHSLKGFLVTSLQDNPTTLMELPVWDIQTAVAELHIQNSADYYILVATPDDTHLEISKTLEAFGCHHYTCLDSKTRESLMEKYYKESGEFRPLKELSRGTEKCNLSVFMARFHRDRVLKSQYERPEWIHPLQVGKALTDVKIADFADDEGENISAKNPNYCELTALYWIWKNRMSKSLKNGPYYGLCHYRRMLDISDEDLYRINEIDVDVILPFPTLHEPDSLEHHTRYIADSDWEAMKTALRELYPAYMRTFSEIFSQPYFYNYNIVAAKRRILADYCDWLFPILARVEELSEPKGWLRSDRYIGYLGENLLTLYFRYHKNDFKIYHTGCEMLT